MSQVFYKRMIVIKSSVIRKSHVITVTLSAVVKFLVLKDYFTIRARPKGKYMFKDYLGLLRNSHKSKNVNKVYLKRDYS